MFCASVYSTNPMLMLRSLPKLILVLLVFAGSSFPASAQTSACFFKTFRLSGSFYERSNSVMVSSAGNIISGGSSSNCSGVTCDNSTALACFTGDGQLKWRCKIGYTIDSDLGDIVEGDDQSVIAAAWIEERTLVYKVDSSGTLVWNKVFTIPGITRAYPYKIIRSGQDYIVGGMATDASYDFSGFLYKVTENGDILWYKEISTQPTDFYITSMAAIGNGEFVMTGQVGSVPMMARLDGNGNVIRARQIPVTGTFYTSASVSLAGDGFLYSTFAVSGGAYVMKSKKNLDYVWSKRFVTSPLLGYNSKVKISGDNTNGCWIASNTAGYHIGWIHIDSTGALVSSGFQSNGSDAAILGVTQTATCQTVISGYLKMPNYNCFVAKLPYGDTLSCLSQTLACTVTDFPVAPADFPLVPATVPVTPAPYNLLVEPGEYVENMVCTTVNTGCASTIGLEEEHPQDFRIYPNPFDDHFYIGNDQLLTGLKLRLFDSTGRLIREIGNPGTIIFTGDLPRGIYLVEITGPGTRYVKKVIHP